MSGDPYVYAGTAVLKNRLGLRSDAELDRVERRFVVLRISEGVSTGDFDLAHLCAIHRHLFQDVYAWAGKIRTVEIAKGGNHFQPCPYLRTGMADIHRRIVDDRHLAGLAPAVFAAKAGIILGDLNYCHPFRDGNGRTQLQYLQQQYLQQLAARAGHRLDLTRLERAAWLHASREAHEGRTVPLADAIAGALG